MIDPTTRRHYLIWKEQTYLVLHWTLSLNLTVLICLGAYGSGKLIVRCCLLVAGGGKEDLNETKDLGRGDTTSDHDDVEGLSDGIRMKRDATSTFIASLAPGIQLTENDKRVRFYPWWS